MTARSGAVVVLASALTACVAPPAPVLPDPGAPAYRLATLDGAPFTATATFRFAEPGRVEGEGPCNRWSASFDAPNVGQMRLGPVMATEMACADLAAEMDFFEALSAMTRIAAIPGDSGDRLRLFTPEGREMVFVP